MSALSCSFEFVLVVGGGDGGGYFQRILCLNPTTVLVVLLLGSWLLLGCDNNIPGLMYIVQQHQYQNGQNDLYLTTQFSSTPLFFKIHCKIFALSP